MPESHESYGGYNRQQIFIAAQWDIEVADQPLVEPPMPHPPKPLKSIIIANTSTEIVHDLHAAQSGPYSGYSPDDEEFEPDEDQMEEGEDFSLEEGLLRGEGDDWTVVLVEFETNEHEDASGDFWLFGGGHLSEGDEVFVAERRTGEECGCEEDIVHIALEGEVLSIN